MSSEVIEFNGIKYRRYPDSPHAQLRNYFFCGTMDRRRGYSSLHRDKWRFAHGKIPAGHQIHHGDENPLNNALDNLECLTRSEHRRRHRMAGEALARQREHLASIRPLAADWHSSPEGIEWHRKHGKESMASRAEVCKVCKVCGAAFSTKQPRAMTCSKACAIKRQNACAKSRHGLECEQCGKPFQAASAKTRFCSRSCKASFTNAARAR